MQSNLVSRPDESSGFWIFWGRLSLGWGIFSTCLKCPTAWTFNAIANEGTLHFVLEAPHFCPAETGGIKGFGDICNFKVIPLVCN